MLTLNLGFEPISITIRNFAYGNRQLPISLHGIRRRGARLATIAVALALILAGCQDAAQPASGESSLRVVASNSVIADIAANLVSESDTVVSLVPRNSDAHGWVPTPNDLKNVGQADLILEVGLEFDDYFLDPMYQSSGSAAQRVGIAEGIELIANSAPSISPRSDDGAAVDSADDGHDDSGDREHAGQEFDPHIWTSIANAKQIAENITDALVAAAPSRGSIYQTNFDEYVAQLEATEGEFINRFAALSDESRQIVTYHSNLAYFAGAYGLEVVGTITGSFTTEASSPSAGQVSALLSDGRADAVFGEVGVDPQAARQLANDAGIIYGGELAADWLGPLDSQRGDYLGMMRVLADQIADVLE